MKKLAALFLILTGCAEQSEFDYSIYCQDYRYVQFICVEACGKFWAKRNTDRLYLFATEENCLSNYNPLFIGVPANGTTE